MSDPYDPQAVEDRPRGSQYVSRKDVRVVAIVLLVLALLAWPIYLYLKKGVDRSLCAKNLRKIGLSLPQYAADFDEHLPFAYETAGFGTSAISLHGDYAYTWQWQLSRYIKEPSTFLCPAAQPEENTKTSDGSTVLLSSYGMLNGYSGLDVSTIANPDARYLISETVRNGFDHTYDPLPLNVEGRKLEDDGFVVGFSNDQTFPNLQTKAATRLAFPNTANGHFDSSSESRHPGGIHFLYVDGHVRLLDGGAANVIRLGGGFGPWDVPPPPARYVPKTRGP